MCHVQRRCQAEFNSSTLTELKQQFKDQPEKEERFKKKRKLCVDLLKVKGVAYQFEISDFEIPEEVVSTEAVGDKKWRAGCLYPVDIFEERFLDAKKRRTVSYQKELDDEGNEHVRVFDDVPGVYRFENYEAKENTHKKVIVNSSLLLSKNQVRENFDAAKNESFNKDK